MFFSDGRAASAPSLNVLEVKHSIPQQLLEAIGKEKDKDINEDFGERMKTIGRRRAAKAVEAMKEEVNGENDALETALPGVKSEGENGQEKIVDAKEKKTVAFEGESLESIEKKDDLKGATSTQRWICTKCSGMRWADVDEEGECNCESKRS